MRMIFRRGRKSLKCYMSFAWVAKPEDLNKFDGYYSGILSQKNINSLDFDIAISVVGKDRRLLRRENSAKAIYRWVEKQNFEPGTIVMAPNWYVGRSDLVIIV